MNSFLEIQLIFLFENKILINFLTEYLNVNFIAFYHQNETKEVSGFSLNSSGFSPILGGIVFSE